MEREEFWLSALANALGTVLGGILLGALATWFWTTARKANSFSHAMYDLRQADVRRVKRGLRAASILLVGALIASLRTVGETRANLNGLDIYWLLSLPPRSPFEQGCALVAWSAVALAVSWAGYTVMVGLSILYRDAMAAMWRVQQGQHSSRPLTKPKPGIDPEDEIYT